MPLYHSSCDRSWREARNAACKYQVKYKWGVQKREARRPEARALRPRARSEEQERWGVKSCKNTIRKRACDATRTPKARAACKDQGKYRIEDGRRTTEV